MTEEINVTGVFPIAVDSLGRVGELNSDEKHGNGLSGAQRASSSLLGLGNTVEIVMPSSETTNNGVSIDTSARSGRINDEHILANTGTSVPLDLRRRIFFNTINADGTLNYHNSVNPFFCYQFFDIDENIYGFHDLNVFIHFAPSANMEALIEVKGRLWQSETTRDFFYSGSVFEEYASGKWEKPWIDLFTRLNNHPYPGGLCNSPKHLKMRIDGYLAQMDTLLSRKNTVCTDVLDSKVTTPIQHQTQHQEHTRTDRKDGKLHTESSQDIKVTNAKTELCVTHHNDGDGSDDYTSTKEISDRNTDFGHGLPGVKFLEIWSEKEDALLHIRRMNMTHLMKEGSIESIKADYRCSEQSKQNSALLSTINVIGEGLTDNNRNGSSNDVSSSEKKQKKLALECHMAHESDEKCRTVPHRVVVGEVKNNLNSSESSLNGSILHRRLEWMMRWFIDGISPVQWDDRWEVWLPFYIRGIDKPESVTIDAIDAFDSKLKIRLRKTLDENSLRPYLQSNADFETLNSCSKATFCGMKDHTPLQSSFVADPTVTKRGINMTNDENEARKGTDFNLKAGIKGNMFQENNSQTQMDTKSSSWNKTTNYEDVTEENTDFFVDVSAGDSGQSLNCERSRRTSDGRHRKKICLADRSSMGSKLTFSSADTNLHELCSTANNGIITSANALRVPLDQLSVRCTDHGIVHCHHCHNNSRKDEKQKEERNIVDHPDDSVCSACERTQCTQAGTKFQPCKETSQDNESASGKYCDLKRSSKEIDDTKMLNLTWITRECVGVATTYNFFSITGFRRRISQFFILPHLHGKGIGLELLASIICDAVLDPKVAYLAVEDPAPAFEQLRDLVEMKICIKANLISLHIQPPVCSTKNANFRDESGCEFKERPIGSIISSCKQGINTAQGNLSSHNKQQSKEITDTNEVSKTGLTLNTTNISDKSIYSFPERKNNYNVKGTTSKSMGKLSHVEFQVTPLVIQKFLKETKCQSIRLYEAYELSKVLPAIFSESLRKDPRNGERGWKDMTSYSNIDKGLQSDLKGGKFINEKNGDMQKHLFIRTQGQENDVSSGISLEEFASSNPCRKIRLAAKQRFYKDSVHKNTSAKKSVSKTQLSEEAKNELQGIWMAEVYAYSRLIARLRKEFISK